MTLSPKERKRKRNRAKKQTSGQCWYCGRSITGVTATLDHLHPVSRGGDNHVRNIVFSCIACNQRKGDHALDDYRKLFNDNEPFFGERLGLTRHNQPVVWTTKGERDE